MSENYILKYSKHSIPKYCSNQNLDERTVAMTNPYGPMTHVDPHTKRNGEPYPNDDIKHRYEIARKKRKDSIEPMHLPTKKKVEYVSKPNTVTIKKHKKQNKHKKRKKQKRLNAPQTQSIKTSKRKSKVPRKKMLSYKINRALSYKVKEN